MTEDDEKEKKEGGGEGKKDSDDTESESDQFYAVLERFGDNIRGCIQYNRRLLDHINDTVDSVSVTEMEVFASSKIGPYFFQLMRQLLMRRINKLQ
jgi:hypothetical protein